MWHDNLANQVQFPPLAYRLQQKWALNIASCKLTINKKIKIKKYNRGYKMTLFYISMIYIIINNIYKIKRIDIMVRMTRLIGMF